MNYLVFDKTDGDVLSVFQGLAGNWIGATDSKGAAWLYADRWAWNFFGNNDYSGDYVVFVLPEPEARRIFADYPDDQVLEELRKAADCFIAGTVIDIQPTTLEEVKENDNEL